MIKEACHPGYTYSPTHIDDFKHLDQNLQVTCLNALPKNKREKYTKQSIPVIYQ
ncbi:MAG: hypothetical protein OSB19_13095 [Opitutaceae bacterium]|nr:hypothetical protein [Opitutaceae bacterium]